MESKDLMRKSTEEYEARLLEHLDLKLQLLDNEEKIKMGADYTPREPSYTYEASEEWKEHMRAVAIHNIKQNRIAIIKQKVELEVKALERKELDEAKNKTEAYN